MPYNSSSTTIGRPPSFSSPSSTLSSYRNTSSYLSSSSNSYLVSRSRNQIHSRTSSLDRSSSRDLPTSTYRPSSHNLTTTSYRSLASSRPIRTSSYVSGITDNAISRRTDIEIKTRLAKLDISTNLRPSSLRSSGTLKSGCDAIHDHSSSGAILTNYRHIGDSSSSILGERTRRTFDSSLDNRRSSDLRSSVAAAAQIVAKNASSYGSTSHLGDSDSALSTTSSSSSGSSSPSLSTGSTRNHGKLSLDENSNRTFLNYKYDSNHNLFSNKNSDEENTDAKSTSSGGGSPSSTASSRHSRYGSTDDVTSYSYGRCRRNSGQASTSGYSSDASSSSNGSPGGSIFRREKHESGGVVGLRNLGNTCFMNSVLQCLINTRPLLEYCLRENYNADINNTISSMKGALIKAFGNLLQTMWKADSNDPAINPQSFKSQIQKFAPRFMGYSQQDAQEFLRYLLQGLHEDVNRVSSKPSPIHTDIDDSLSDNQKAVESWRRYLRFDDSKIVDLFVGQLKSTLKCTVCGHTSVTFDPFWDLSLPIPKAGSTVRLQHCFDLFTKEEVLDGDEKPTCARCKTRRKCTKSFSIQKFPKILVIHLKRFSPSEKYRAKLTTSVDFPMYNLDLGSYATNGNRGHSIYNLYGISNHSGTVYTGHYTAYCRHPYSGEWHDFNDSRVSKVATSSISSSEAYVLFYEQVTHSSRL